MRIARYCHEHTDRFGVLEDGVLTAFPDSVTTLDECIALVAADRPWPRSARPAPLAQVVLLAPVSARKNVFCVGRNYLGHAEEIARARGTALNLPSVPTFFTKAPTAIAAPNATLQLRADISQQYDWEAELAVIIARRCRDVSESDALDVVFGYTCLNDMTARDLQKEHGQWFKGKSLDQTCPLGPWIVTADELRDPQGLDITLRVNGAVKQSSNTSMMIFSVRRIIASLSRGMTLEPGDVIATGTPDGVGFARTPPEFLKDGDSVEVEIQGIGVLSNTVGMTGTALS